MPGSVGTGNVSDMCRGFGSRRYGDRSWSKILVGWKEWQDKASPNTATGADLYGRIGKNKGIEPDPQILAYPRPTKIKRADLSKWPFPHREDHLFKPVSS